jgi:predicted TIM-barrel fold metal-dependent hydrolase
MDALNLRVMVDLSGGTDPSQIKQKVDAINASAYKDRFRVFANVQWNGAGGAGWQEKAVGDLRQAVKNGAIGLKIFKDLGMTAKKADGTVLKVDDPVLDPIWDLCAELNIPSSFTQRSPRNSSRRSTTTTNAGSS